MENSDNWSSNNLNILHNFRHYFRGKFNITVIFTDRAGSWFYHKWNWEEWSLNGVVLGVIGGIITNVILIVMMYLQGYGDFIVSIISTALIYLVLEIVVATVGGVFGSLLRIEFDKSEMEYEEVEE